MHPRIIAVFLLLISTTSYSQLSDVQLNQIDSLFISWNVPNHPGGAVGVMIDGEMVYEKAFGLASMEYLVPNTTETIFNTGSVSKQFTAMGIILLHNQGKLSVDDELKKYVPDLPDFGEKITIRHLLHHTSGLRSFHAVLALAGWRGDDYRTNEDIFELMTRQQDLNFKPGDEYLYCNTGYIYMAKIIEEVTGQSFPDYMKEHVFEPLGLDHTYVEDQYNRIVPQNATSYDRTDEGFVREVEYWGYIGSGNMHSTVEDLCKWGMNFHKPQEGWAEHFALLETVDPFNNGEPNTYAFGVNVLDYNGTKQVSHGGSVGGFRAYLTNFPEKKVSVAVLTNFSNSGSGQKGMAVADIVLDLEEEESGETAKTEFITLKTKDLQKFEGSFWNHKDKYARKIYLKDDTLRYFRSEYSESALAPVGKNTFKMLGVGVNLLVEFKKSTMIVNIEGEPPIPFTQFEPTESSEEELKSYTGTYYSPELLATYTIALKDGELICHHPRHGEMKMQRLKQDVLSGNWPMVIVEMQRNEAGEIEGVRVSNGRVRGLWMEKR